MASVHSILALLLTSLLLILCSQAPTANGAEPRRVFAHYMLYADVGIEIYKMEIQLAQSKGIDAFALNSNVWRPDLVSRMYRAAEELNTDFKIFFSADIHKDNNGNLSPDNLVAMLNYKSHPNQMRYAGKSLFTTWLGNEDSWWADFNMNAWDGWNSVFQRAGGKDQFCFLPFFPTDGSKYGVIGMLNTWGSTVDGLFAWDTSSWPYRNVDNGVTDYNNPTNAMDRNYLNGCSAVGKTYMASVSPGFFKTQPFDSCQVKGNYQGPRLWLTRWQQVINDNIPLVEVVTWNDWPESSYIAPQFTAQGAALDVTKFSHRAYLELGAYYIKWYKDGAQPAITSNGIFMFYYTNSKSGGGDCQLKDVLSDNVYVTTMLRQPGTLVLSSGSTVQSFSAPAGIQTFSINFQEGQPSAEFTPSGGGGTRTTLTGDERIRNSGSAPNFNVFSTFVTF